MASSGKWALVLGGSSGLGLATAKKLAMNGFNLFVIHRDRKVDMPTIQHDFDEIRSLGANVHAFNSDAVSAASRLELIKNIQEQLGSDKLAVVVHSIAKGHVKPMQNQGSHELTGQDFQLTIDAMAVSLYDWVKALVDLDLFAPDSRIIAFTSEGNTKAIPGYAAVSAAKSALEAISRNIALEFAEIGIKSNCIQAGVTITKSFQIIPNSESIKKAALRRNPHKRLTTPEDVANAAYLLTTDEARWITGTIIKVDGGESLQ